MIVEACAWTSHAVPRGSKTGIHVMCNVRTAGKSAVHNILDEVRKQQCGQG